MGMFVCSQKTWIIFTWSTWFTTKWSVKHRIARKGRCLQEDVDLEDSTPVMNEVFLGCTQRSGQADTKIVKSEAELYTMLTDDGRCQ